MENSLKGLILAAGTIITCVVISLGFYISREAKNTASTGTNQINKVNTEFAESDKTIYDGTNISGSEVVSVIKRLEGEQTGVYVKTTESNTFYGYEFNIDSGELVQMTTNKYTSTDASSKQYINPYATYIGEVVRNSNNAITGLIFTQN